MYMGSGFVEDAQHVGVPVDEEFLVVEGDGTASVFGEEHGVALLDGHGHSQATGSHVALSGLEDFSHVVLVVAALEH